MKVHTMNSLPLKVNKQSLPLYCQSTSFSLRGNHCYQFLCSHWDIVWIFKYMDIHSLLFFYRDDSIPCKLFGTLFFYIKIYFLPKFCPNEISCFLFELILTISSGNCLFPQYFPVVFRVRTTNKVLHTHWSVNPTSTSYKVSKQFGPSPVTPDVG